MKKLRACLFLLLLCGLFKTASTIKAQTTNSFTYVGVNMPSLMRVDDKDAQDTLQYLATQCGVNLVRIFGTSDRGGATEIQRIANLAAANNIKLIVPLVDMANGSPEFDTSTYLLNPTQWFQSVYQTAYLSYVKSVAQALKGNTAILAFELANEPSCRQGSTTDSCNLAYNAWVNTVSQAIKNIDPTRKVSIGQIAWSFDIPNYVLANNPSTIDFTGAHYYPVNPDTPISSALQALNLSKTQINNKPFYVGEVGYWSAWGSDGYPVTDRSAELLHDMAIFRTHGAVGFLYWQYSGDRNLIATAQFSDSYSFFKGDPLCQALKQGKDPLSINTFVTSNNVTVSFTNAPSYTNDWIGIYTPNASDSAYINWKFLNNTQTQPITSIKTGQVSFNSLPPGNYEARYFISDSSLPYPWDVVASSSFSISKPGDANNDGKVDGLDYVIWLNNFGKSVNNGYISGDFNNDGKVDSLDYVIWLNNYQN